MWGRETEKIALAQKERRKKKFLLLQRKNITIVQFEKSSLYVLSLFRQALHNIMKIIGLLLGLHATHFGSSSSAKFPIACLSNAVMNNFQEREKTCHDIYEFFNLNVFFSLLRVAERVTQNKKGARDRERQKRGK